MKKSISVSNLTLDLWLDYVRPAARAAGLLEEVPARDDWHEFTAEVIEEVAADEVAHCMYCACMCAGNDGVERSHEEYVRHEAERMIGQLEISIKYDLHGYAAPLTALLAALTGILNPDPTDTIKEDDTMTIKETLTRVDFDAMRAYIEGEKRFRSAWYRGVKVYALEMVEELEENITGGYVDIEKLFERRGLREALLNGAQDWKQYSYGGSALIYDGDIAERLCCPSELKKTRGGEWRPTSREDWLDVQARALRQAANMVYRALDATTVVIETVTNIDDMQSAAQAM